MLQRDKNAISAHLKFKIASGPCRPQVSSGIELKNLQNTEAQITATPCLTKKINKKWHYSVEAWLQLLKDKSHLCVPVIHPLKLGK